VSTRDREADSSVIEARWLPCGCAVAVLACLRQSKRSVIRIQRLSEVRHMAPNTVGGCPFVFATHVTTQAVERGMGSSKGVASNLQVVETRAEPGRDGMALLAGTREPCCDMVGRRSLLIGSGMTGIALERKTLKLPDGGGFVATVTLQGRMPAHQRKAVLVVPHRPQRDLPAVHAVASRTVGPHLTPVYIGVAIGASLTRIRKHQLGVALRTAYVQVQSLEWKVSFVVIEFRDRANYLPSRHGMAVLTGNIQLTVWTNTSSG